MHRGQRSLRVTALRQKHVYSLALQRRSRRGPRTWHQLELQQLFLDAVRDRELVDGLARILALVRAALGFTCKSALLSLSMGTISKVGSQVLRSTLARSLGSNLHRTMR